MQTFLQDLRFALRLFSGNRSFALLALLPLALAIGANAAVLGLVDALLLRPMPGITARGLVWISAVEHGKTRLRSPVSYPELDDLRRGAGVFDEVALFRAVPLNVRLVAGRDPGRVEGMIVSGNYFATLGVRPALGRWFVRDEDEAPGTHPVAVIGYEVWQGEFGGDPRVLGRHVEINGHDFAVVGVAPAGFVGCEMREEAPAVWVPIAMHAVLSPSERALLPLREFATFQAVGRLRPGLSIADARPALHRLAARLRADHAGTPRQPTFVLDEVRGGAHPSDHEDVLPLAGVALAIGAVVLVIACANVGGLLVGRATTRGREIGIRLALGAGRARLVRQFLTESLLLATVAGGLGLLIATWTTGALVAALGVPFTLEVTPDLPTLAGTLGISFAAAFLFGLAPALHAVGPHGGGSAARVAPLLADTAGATRRRARLRRCFAAAQVALSLSLLATAGLLLRSVRTEAGLARQDGELDRVLTASIDLAAQGYSTSRQLAFSQDLLERVQGLPGVEKASLGTAVPGRSSTYNVLFADGRPAEPGSRPFTRVAWVWPGYFEAVGVSVTRGRDFMRSDRPGAPLVAIVNEPLARAFWQGDDPVGKLVRLGTPRGAAYEVVGVVRERVHAPGGPEAPAVFFARPQQAEMVLPLTVVARAAGGGATLAPELRRIVRELDPSLPVFDLATLRQVYDSSLLPKRAGSAALNIFGGLALFLAAIGVYGLVAWMVGSRQREIGVRMAMGATSAHVLALVMGEGARIAAAGGAVGLVLAIAATRLISGMVAGAALWDVAMFGGVAAIVLGVVAVASYVPARRATRVDPAVILRAE